MKASITIGKEMIEGQLAIVNHNSDSYWWTFTSASIEVNQFTTRPTAGDSLDHFKSIGGTVDE